jgi:hypothetical protein
VVVSTGKRFSVNMVSSVNPKGGLHSRLLDGGLNTASFIDYLEALLHDVPGKIFLVRHRMDAEAGPRRASMMSAHSPRTLKPYRRPVRQRSADPLQRARSAAH